MRKNTRTDQVKLQHWARLIHECQNYGLKKKEWLANRGISKDTYYYWYKKVQTAYIEAMDIPETYLLLNLLLYQYQLNQFLLSAMK